MTGGDRSPQAPRLGRAARLLGRFHVTGLFWVRLLVLGVRVCPEVLKPAVLNLFVLLFLLVLPRINRALAANLVPVLGPAGWLGTLARRWRTLHACGWCLTERWERLLTDLPFEVALDGAEHWAAACAGGRGFVMVTAHVGMWEAGSLTPSEVEQRVVHVVREPELHRETQEHLEPLIRERVGGRYVTHFATGDPALGIALLEALRAGEIVALQGDRPRARSRTVAAAIFGRPFPLPAGPAALARAAGVPLVPVFTLREGRRRYRIHVRPLIEAGDPAAATRQLAGEIEAVLRRAPHQWFCLAEAFQGT